MVVLPSLLFTKKFSRQVTPLDEIKSALASLRAMLDPLSTIGCKSFAQKVETANQIAHALVPVSVVPATTSMDTTLYAFDAGVPDSSVQAVTIGQTMLWKCRSDNYYFVLTHKSGK